MVKGRNIVPSFVATSPVSAEIEPQLGPVYVCRMTIRASILLLSIGLPAASAAQPWDELDCRLVLDALQAQAGEAASLRENSDTLSTALRGSNFALWEKTVEPQLVETPASSDP
jgi:hypothetical protein